MFLFNVKLQMPTWYSGETLRNKRKCIVLIYLRINFCIETLNVCKTKKCCLLDRFKLEPSSRECDTNIVKQNTLNISISRVSIL